MLRIQKQNESNSVQTETLQFQFYDDSQRLILATEYTSFSQENTELNVLFYNVLFMRTPYTLRVYGTGKRYISTLTLMLTPSLDQLIKIDESWYQFQCVSAQPQYEESMLSNIQYAFSNLRINDMEIFDDFRLLVRVPGQYSFEVGPEQLQDEMSFNHTKLSPGETAEVEAFGLIDDMLVHLGCACQSCVSDLNLVRAQHEFSREQYNFLSCYQQYFVHIHALQERNQCTGKDLQYISQLPLFIQVLFNVYNKEITVNKEMINKLQEFLAFCAKNNFNQECSIDGQSYKQLQLTRSQIHEQVQYILQIQFVYTKQPSLDNKLKQIIRENNWIYKVSVINYKPIIIINGIAANKDVYIQHGNQLNVQYFTNFSAKNELDLEIQKDNYQINAFDDLLLQIQFNNVMDKYNNKFHTQSLKQQQSPQTDANNQQTAAQHDYLVLQKLNGQLHNPTDIKQGNQSASVVQQLQQSPNQNESSDKDIYEANYSNQGSPTAEIKDKINAQGETQKITQDEKHINIQKEEQISAQNQQLNQSAQSMNVEFEQFKQDMKSPLDCAENNQQMTKLRQEMPEGVYDHAQSSLQMAKQEGDQQVIESAQNNSEIAQAQNAGRNSEHTEDTNLNEQFQAGLDADVATQFLLEQNRNSDPQPQHASSSYEITSQFLNNLNAQPIYTSPIIKLSEIKEGHEFDNDTPYERGSQCHHQNSLLKSSQDENEANKSHLQNNSDCVEVSANASQQFHFAQAFREDEGTQSMLDTKQQEYMQPQAHSEEQLQQQWQHGEEQIEQKDQQKTSLSNKSSGYTLQNLVKRNYIALNNNPEEQLSPKYSMVTPNRNSITNHQEDYKAVQQKYNNYNTQAFFDEQHDKKIAKTIVYDKLCRENQNNESEEPQPINRQKFKHYPKQESNQADNTDGERIQQDRRQTTRQQSLKQYNQDQKNQFPVDIYTHHNVNAIEMKPERVEQESSQKQNIVMSARQAAQQQNPQTSKQPHNIYKSAYMQQHTSQTNQKSDLQLHDLEESQKSTKKVNNVPIIATIPEKLPKINQKSMEYYDPEFCNDMLRLNLPQLIRREKQLEKQNQIQKMEKRLRQSFNKQLYSLSGVKLQFDKMDISLLSDEQQFKNRQEQERIKMQLHRVEDVIFKASKDVTNALDKKSLYKVLK